MKKEMFYNRSRVNKAQHKPIPQKKLAVAALKNMARNQYGAAVKIRIRNVIEGFRGAMNRAELARKQSMAWWSVNVNVMDEGQLGLSIRSSKPEVCERGIPPTSK